MDALGLVRQDHRRLEGLLERFAQSDGGDPAERAVLAGQVETAVRHHVAVEEELLYPAYRRRATDTRPGLDLLDEGEEQHRLIGVLTEELAGMDPDGDGFTAKLRVLAEQIHKHLDAEEAGLLTAIEDLLGDDELLDLGRRIEDRKRVVAAQEELAASIGPAGGPRRRLLAVVGGVAAVAVAAAMVLARRRRPPQSTQPRLKPFWSRPRRGR
jgi:hemerythrin-like domain-containing protein